ncbi:AAA family ATPase [Halococcus thailandensis]|uniref:Methanol dehydrogenase regulatory protein n=1 Tax=Halococcus thailandensis JCM 13552 TaxID=1227457 RepID=M0NG40_9EURY|nr:MoxR family ATPase [Halococcus thailandensis]EMA56826.1 methanol dehydrogenase regulatory protein [Halococcus thailandensis JCM 13552]
METTDTAVGDPGTEINAVFDSLSTTVIADRELLETVLLGTLARGHVLLEDVPGTGKTLIARSVARTLGLSFSRIQFTPDLLPADVTGTHVYNEKTGEFEFSRGPVFANVVLADEINRAPPKTQAALLEAMEEHQVTADGETHDLPEPFFVIATQNPVEMAGTFELPEAQVDRFLVKTTIGYPGEEGETELLRRRDDRNLQSPSATEVLSADEVRALQDIPESIRVKEDLLEYMVALSRATREHSACNVGVSPRGTQRLFEAARVRAILSGREYVTPEDVKRIAQPVLAHRLVLTPDAVVESVDKHGVIKDVLDDVSVPTI